MASGFPGGFPDFFNVNGGGLSNVAGKSLSMMNVNRNNYNPHEFYRSPLAGILSDSSSLVGVRRPDLIGKRSLAEFQQHQQLRQQASAYLRQVKARTYNQQASSMEFMGSPEVSSVSDISSSSAVSGHAIRFPQELRRQSFNTGNGNFNGVMNNYLGKNQETERKMINRLQELEKQLLLDDDDDGEDDGLSVVTTGEWSETIQNLLRQAKNPSPATSSTSSCASSSASPAATVSPKQLISDAAEAIADGKQDTAVEFIIRLNQVSDARGTPEQRLSYYMAAALRSRVRVNSTAAEQPSLAADLYGKQHLLSTQLLYDKSPCFKLAFMAANNVILEAFSGSGQPGRNIHVVDFDIGQGVQYADLLHEIAAAREDGEGLPISLKLTTFKDFGNEGVERLKLVGDGLKLLSNKLGVLLSFNILDLKLSDLSTAALAAEVGDFLAVNFAFKLNKLPDESVTTENLRDEVLRCVKRLSPAVVTVVEQELNANTASFPARVNEAFTYYGALLDSFDSTILRDNPERVKIEEGLSRIIFNSVACEGRSRVERCEVFGKWRARMRMAGFDQKPVSQLTTELLTSRLNSGIRGNPGFTVKEDSGGVRFGWLGRTVTVVSAWH